MIRARGRSCANDSDYARFARFYIRHCRQFHPDYTFADALLHLVQTLPQSQVLLLEDGNGELIGFGYYRYEPEGDTVFVDSVILAEEHRSSFVFLQSFRELARTIRSERQSVRTFKFHALDDHRYLNRLYGKFAEPVGRVEQEGRTKRVYAASWPELLRYLRLDNEQPG